MDTQITLLLDSDDVQDRKKAVRMLAQTGTQEALRVLAGVYKNDPDAGIRDLAIKAGKYIKTQEVPAVTAPTASPEPKTRRTTTSSVAVPAAAPEPKTRRTTTSAPVVERVVETPVEAEEDYTPVFVSEKRLTQAASLLDEAMSALTREDYPKAIDTVVKAFKTNPNYRMDSYAMSVAHEITQLEGREFFALLEDDSLVRDLIREARAQNQPVDEKGKKKPVGDDGETSWENVLADLALYYAIVTGVVIIALIISVQLRSNIQFTMPSCPTCTIDDQRSLQQMTALINIWRSLTPVQAVLAGLVCGTAVVMYVLLYFTILHAISWVFLGQGGSYKGILHRGSRILMMTYGLGLVFAAIALFMVISAKANPDYIKLYGESGILDNSPINPVWKILVLAGFVLTLGGAIWLVNTVANHYNAEWYLARRAMAFTYMATSSIQGLVIAEFLAHVFTTAPK